MKFNLILSLISTALACLIGYLAYIVAEGQDNDIVYGIGSTICFLSTLMPIMGITSKSTRLGINLKLTAVLFFVLFFISNFCFATLGVNISIFIIANGVLLTVFSALFYKMNQSQEI